MKPSLKTYHQKRDFSVSTEPRGAAPRKAAARALRYVVQRHQARRLHYDFRLEINGVLVSWAIPKGPSLDPGTKRLAIQVEDHPLEYGDFEGTIPQGQYGAGQVEIWDSGVWTPATSPEKALNEGHIKFELDGSLKGQWLLVRTGRTATQWLLRKLEDQHATPGHDAERHGLPMTKTRNAPKAKSGISTPSARLATPDTLAPQLATLAERPPVGKGWSYEFKYDGYRMLCRLQGREARLFSRNGKNWNARMKALAQSLGELGLGNGWIDGEVVCFDHQGISRFQALQQALDGNAGELVFVAFDLPFWNGTDLRKSALSKRRKRLHEILEVVPADGPLMLTQTLNISSDTEGEAAWIEACRLGLEGLMCKRLDAPYTEGRSTSWLKLKCRPDQEFVVGGYTEPSGQRAHFGALLVGLYEGKTLRYAGRVGTGFSQEALKALHQRLSTLHRKTSPFTGPVESSSRYQKNQQTVQWVSPKLVIEVDHAGWTQSGVLRQASFKGVREDKPASRVGGESIAVPSSTGTVTVTNPQRVIYTKPDITKQQLVSYYQSVSAWIMPHLSNRRVALLRCPRGTNVTCFFQKHLHSQVPPGIELDDEQLIIQSEIGLLELVQLGVIEFHTWGASQPHPGKPDRITLDLDPDPDLAWADIVLGARMVQRLMQEAGLAPYLKTTGGKGLHLVAPINARHTWTTVKSFAKALAAYLAREAPAQFTSKASKSARNGRIFVDYLRNGEGSTAVAAFSARARQGAPVSMPISWAELDSRHDLRAACFNIGNALEYRRTQASDPWQNYAGDRTALRLAFLKELN